LNYLSVINLEETSFDNAPHQLSY